VTDNLQPTPARAGGGPRSTLDTVLLTAVVVVGVVLVIVLALIGWSVFGPKPAPRTEAERLLQAGLAAVASNPTSSTAHIDLGGAYLEIGEYDQAEKEFLAAQKYAPGSPVPLYDLGHVYRLTGRHEEAAKAFAEVVSKAPDALKFKAPGKMFQDARYWLGVEYLELKRPADAIDALGPLTQNQPLDAEAGKAIARAYEAAGDVSRAAGWYQAVLRVQPQDTEAAAALKRLGK